MKRSERPITRILTVLSSVWLIAGVAFATRMAFVWDQQRKIPHEVLATVPFDQETGNIALALSEGKGYGNLFRRSTGPTAWLAPVYPFLLSTIFRVFGPLTIGSFFAAVTLNALFSAAATFPLFWITRRVSGIGLAAASAWIWVFLPAGVLMPFEWIWDTSLSVLLAVILIWATLRVAELARVGDWIAYGVLWGLALLTNPVLGIGLPFLFVWAGLRARQRLGTGWKWPLVSLGLVFVCCVPWTVRNYERFHRLIPIRSNLAFELWIGNNSIFDPHAVHGIQRITRYEETRRYAEMGENAYLDAKRAEAISFIRGNPRLFAQLTLRRVVATWAGTEHPFTDLANTDSWLARSVLIVNGILTFGAIAGVALLWLRRDALTFPISVFPVSYPLVYYVTHSSLRYRHPIDPLLVLLTVFALSCCFRAGRTGTRSSPRTA